MSGIDAYTVAVYETAIRRASKAALAAVEEARKWRGTPCHWERDAGSYAALAAHYGFKLMVIMDYTRESERLNR